MTIEKCDSCDEKILHARYGYIEVKTFAGRVDVMPRDILNSIGGVFCSLDCAVVRMKIVSETRRQREIDAAVARIEASA